jgi:hypothetical protein
MAGARRCEFRRAKRVLGDKSRRSLSSMPGEAPNSGRVIEEVSHMSDVVDKRWLRSKRRRKKFLLLSRVPKVLFWLAPKLVPLFRLLIEIERFIRGLDR